LDDLDRLYLEFVEIARRERGAAFTEPMTVLELHDELIPYRRVRDPADLRSNDDYELALSRMLAGERDYLLSDGNMQDEVRAGLEETLPDLRRYRAFPSVRVWLNPDEIPPPGHIRYAPPEVRDQIEWSVPQTTDDSAATHSEVEDSIVEEVTEEEDLVEEESYEEEDSSRGADLDDIVLRDDPDEILTRETTEDADVEPRPPEEGPAEPATELEICVQCGTDLPVSAAFCPFCGKRLWPENCEACGAELESAWRFCAACGAPRSGEGPGPA